MKSHTFKISFLSEGLQKYLLQLFKWRHSKYLIQSIQFALVNTYGKAAEANDGGLALALLLSADANDFFSFSTLNMEYINHHLLMKLYLKIQNMISVTQYNLEKLSIKK